ncbi:GumC family protein [Paraurantiacibacter namhicola]|uniref:non-specific protein-tyrosine kinase n=1 Tax=Paraurantiacibacter namhicola TaxID=645517 RepID=A0A1C7D5Y6_9SPHN|nr:polysaccharide biosynthesis tyrosine autokinase [Paraurantiacibacter namhicola]ANU06906.1 Putative tyrosine-protein kinase in cps region [Paraurantiacibacter namhicola]
MNDARPEFSSGPQDWRAALGLGNGRAFGGLGDTLRYLLSLLKRNIWLILTIIGATMLLALVLTMLQTPQYTARATVEINERADEVLGEELDSDGNNSVEWEVDRYLNTQLEILRSRALAERVADRLDLASDPAFFLAMGAPGTADLPDGARKQAVIGMLMSGFSVDLPRETRIAQIFFTSNDREMSARVTNAYAQEFIQANLQRKYDSSAYARQFVAEQLDEARQALEESERELNSYARDAGLIRARNPDRTQGVDSDYAGSITASSLVQANRAANDAQAARVAAEARWNAERSAPLMASPAVQNSEVVQQLAARRGAVQSELQAARGRYLPGHPTLQRLEAEAAGLDAQVAQAAREARGAVQAQYRAAVATERQLQGQVRSLEGRTLAEQDRSVRYNVLAREADTNRQLYDGLLQRYRELNAAAGITASNIAVVDLAQPPGGPSSPNLTINLLLGLLVGIGLAGTIVFLRDQLDDRIRVPEDLESKVGMGLVGVIPRAEADDPVAALENAKSPVAEAYNALRTALLYSTRDGLPGVLLVTSAQPLEGKSTSSLAIAKGFARLGRKVLLVDADLRRPSLHKRAGIANEAGLSSVLVGETALSETVVQDKQENLFLLPSGPIPPSPTELLSSPRMAAMLEQGDAEYDLVIVDSAPILGLADSPELAALADGVLVVIEADRARGGQLKAALRRLRDTRPNILGAVLTKFDPAKAGNSYSAYYGYDYYRYDPETETA